MTLSEYLAARGKSKALTKIEALAFGVPYPLVNGWPRRHGSTVITPAMLAQLRATAGECKSAAAMRALRGMDAGTGVAGPVVRKRGAVKLPPAAKLPARRAGAPSFPGFRLRGKVGAAGAGRLPWE